ncbi:MAG: hypothetical protein IPN11_01170 [Opitutaceae bacterium]|nr:hypothetical protein [Opitutaceae bacterium]
MSTTMIRVGPGLFSRLAATLLLCLAFTGSATAAPITHDLGQGLTYVHVAGLPADLPGQKDLRACVLDLRYTRGDDTAAAALAAWLKFHASARTPVYVLANADTATPLLAILTPDRLPAGTLTIGRPGGGFTPDIAVQSDAAAERRAFNALASGAQPASLLQENSGKTRYDEAAIVRQLAGDEPPAGTGHPPETGSADEAVPPPLIDRTLQRAVHVHHGLAALKLFRG